jgi:hypothetical protein
VAIGIDESTSATTPWSRNCPPEDQVYLSVHWCLQVNVLV